MIYTLPTSVEVNGREYKVRSDFRDILTTLEAVADVELTDQDRAEAVLTIFYPDLPDMPSSDYEEAVAQYLWFINCGQIDEEGKFVKKLVDWEQDFPLIVAPVNRVLGKEVRATKHLHWWTFISAYREIGDCLFAQVVSIRQKLSSGKPLDKSDKDFYRKNRSIVDIQKRYTEWECEKIRKWV